MGEWRKRARDEEWKMRSGMGVENESEGWRSGG